MAGLSGFVRVRPGHLPGSVTGQYYCDMTPGCSGGAWIARWNPDDHAGYLVGTTSGGGPKLGGRIASSAAFGAVAYDIFQLAVRGD